MNNVDVNLDGKLINIKPPIYKASHQKGGNTALRLYGVSGDEGKGIKYS